MNTDKTHAYILQTNDTLREYKLTREVTTGAMGEYKTRTTNLFWTLYFRDADDDKKRIICHYTEAEMKALYQEMKKTGAVIVKDTDQRRHHVILRNYEGAVMESTKWHSHQLFLSDEKNIQWGRDDRTDAIKQLLYTPKKQLQLKQTNQ